MVHILIVNNNIKINNCGIKEEEDRKVKDHKDGLLIVSCHICFGLRENKNSSFKIEYLKLSRVFSKKKIIVSRQGHRNAWPRSVEKAKSSYHNEA